MKFHREDHFSLRELASLPNCCPADLEIQCFGSMFFDRLDLHHRVHL